MRRDAPNLRVRTHFDYHREMSNYRRSRAGSHYFFTAVTHNRQPILTAPHGRNCLRNAFKQVQSKMPFEVTGIVLLPDHLHAIWQMPGDDMDYSVRWRRIKSIFTRTWLSSTSSNSSISLSRRKRNEQGVWQRRFFEHTLKDENDLKRCADYLHVNPLKHGYVKRVSEWPWSSFHKYVKAGEYSNDWGSSSIWYGDEFKYFE